MFGKRFSPSNESLRTVSLEIPLAWGLTRKTVHHIW